MDPSPEHSGSGWTLESWLDALAAALDVDVAVHTDALLDLTREVAHGVARPAAPLTLYLVGAAVAARGGGADDVAAVLATARELVAAPPASTGDAGS